MIYYSKNKKRASLSVSRRRDGFTPSNRFASRNSTGFTLIEMIVSVGIFTIVMTIALGALLVVYDTYRKTRTLKNAMENVNIATESMIKKIRTGSQIECIPFELNPCSKIKFKGEEGIYYRYRLYNGKIERCKSNFDICYFNMNFSPITSPDIQIKDLKFYLYGIDDPLIQDSVTVVITGFSDIPGKPKYDSTFHVQTTVSKRLLDVF